MRSAMAPSATPVTFVQVQAVVAQRCAICHNAEVQNKAVALHTPELQLTLAIPQFLPSEHWAHGPPQSMSLSPSFNRLSVQDGGISTLTFSEEQVAGVSASSTHSD